MLEIFFILIVVTGIYAALMTIVLEQASKFDTGISQEHRHSVMFSFGLFSDIASGRGKFSMIEPSTKVMAKFVIVLHCICVVGLVTFVAFSLFA